MPTNSSFEPQPDHSSLSSTADQVTPPDEAHAAAATIAARSPAPAEAALSRGRADDGTRVMSFPDGDDPMRPPGPGLPEAVAWTIGVVIVHLVAAAVLLVGITVHTVLSAQLTDPGEIQAVVQRVISESPAMLIGFEQAVFLFIAVVATIARLGRSWWRSLNPAPINPLHFALMIMLLLPLQVISSALYEVGMGVWKVLREMFPSLSFWDQLNAVEAVQDLVGELSLPYLLLTIAVVPALAEELVFRGVVGRGLTARWGLPAGILLTSILFAAVHAHPAHVAGVLPLGICIHLLYVTTRSFWAPVLFHFFNNAIATLVMKYNIAEPADAAAAAAGSSPIVVFSAVVCAGLLASLLWRTRVRHYLEDGNVWNPGYPTLERPPLAIHAHAGRRHSGLPLALAAIISCVAFALASSWSMSAADPTQNGARLREPGYDSRLVSSGSKQTPLLLPDSIGRVRHFGDVHRTVFFG